MRMNLFLIRLVICIIFQNVILSASANGRSLLSDSQSPKKIKTDGDWTSCMTPDGKTYYANNLTKQRQWNKPDGLFVETSVAASPKGVDTRQRCGDWMQCVDDKSGRTYYANTKTKEVSWSKPSGWIDNKAAGPPLPVPGGSKSVAPPLPVPGRSRSVAAALPTNNNQPSSLRPVPQSSPLLGGSTSFAASPKAEPTNHNNNKTSSLVSPQSSPRGINNNAASLSMVGAASGASQPMLQSMDDAAQRDKEMDTATRDRLKAQLRQQIEWEIYQKECEDFRSLTCKDKLIKYGCCIPCFGCCCNGNSGCAMWNIWGISGSNLRGKLFDCFTCCGYITKCCCIRGKGSVKKCACCCCCCDWCCDQCMDYWRFNKAMVEHQQKDSCCG